MDDANNNLITIGQLARKLRISVLWIRRQADKGVLPCIDADGKLFFNLEAVKMKLTELAATGGHND